jgi:hypothetical protein
MPEAAPGISPAKEAESLDSLRSRSERAWQQAQAAWTRAQEMQARQAAAARPCAREPHTVPLHAQLETRLATMPVIEQAKGVLMARQGCDAGQAFDLLCRIAQRSNLPVRELAEQIVKKAQRRVASA